jgi:outer membrane immunogenic protein
MKAKAPPAATAINWTGFYLGGFGGATQGTADWGYADGSVSPHVAGYLFGGAAGYNWQFDSYVLGVQADLSKTDTNGSLACGPNNAAGAFTAGATPSPMFQMNCNAWAYWMATATARIGYTWDRALFYAKVGGAWTNEHVNTTCNFGIFNTNLIPGGAGNSGLFCTNPAGKFTNGIQATKGMGGYDVGWGTEYALTAHWSATAEADYIGFGDRNVVASDGSVLKVGMHLWEEKIGVNYRF